jgi:hypothetical protein
MRWKKNASTIGLTRSPENMKKNRNQIAEETKTGKQKT